MSNELIKAWQLDPSKENEKKMVEAHKPFITASINKWKGIVPDPVLNAYGNAYALNAFKSFDPEKASINTHLHNNISQLSRIIYQNANSVRIPEHQIQMIGKVNQAQEHLQDVLGRDPSIDEIADHLSLPKQHIAKVIKNQRADFLNDSDTEMQTATTGEDSSLSNRIFSYRQSLDEHKQKQFDSLTGYGKTTALSPQDFGKQFKLKPYEVSRLKAHFAKGLK